MLNLYQSQCLTVDRDAPDGKFEEIWSVPLSDGTTGVLLANKGPVKKEITLNWSMLGWNDDLVVKIRDLWKLEDLPRSYSTSFSSLVNSHGVVVLKISPV